MANTTPRGLACSSPATMTAAPISASTRARSFRFVILSPKNRTDPAVTKAGYRYSRRDTTPADAWRSARKNVVDWPTYTTPPISRKIPISRADGRGIFRMLIRLSINTAPTRNRRNRRVYVPVPYW